MFGWGSVASALNTDKSVCAWKINSDASELTVFKSVSSESTFDVPSQQDTQIIVKGVCNAAANRIIEDYVADTRAWITSAESKMATMAEYQRIGNVFREFTKQTDVRQELMQGRSQNSDILVLKRHRITDQEAPAKRLKIEAVDQLSLEDLGEMTQQGEFYSVIAGGLTKRLPNKGIVSVKAPDQFALDSIVPPDTATEHKVPEPSNMLSQPFRNSLQLKSHMTSLVQAFEGGGRKNPNDILAVPSDTQVHGNCFRHKTVLFNEYKLAVRTFANILTRRANPELKSEFVIMEPGIDPVVLRKLNSNTHVSPNNIARVIYRISRIVDSSTRQVTYNIEFRRPRRPSSLQFSTFATITYDNEYENASQPGNLNVVPGVRNVDDIPFCYIFRVPQAVHVDEEGFSRLSMNNLYNLSTEPTNYNIALGRDTNEQTYIETTSPMLKVKYCWFKDFFIGSSATVDKFSLGNPLNKVLKSVSTAGGADALQTAYYSSEILEPCVEAATEQQSNGLAMTKSHTVHNVVHFLHTVPSMPNHGNAFQQMCAIEMDKCNSNNSEIGDQSWFLRLVPVNETEVDWMSSQNTSIAEFTFQSMAEESNSSFAWFLGGTPSPTLDALDGALSFLSSQCSYNPADSVQIALFEADPSTMSQIMASAYSKKTEKAFLSITSAEFTPFVVDTLVANLNHQLRIIKLKESNATNDSVLVQSTVTKNMIIGFAGILNFVALKMQSNNLLQNQKVEIYFQFTKLLQDIIKNIEMTTATRDQLIDQLINGMTLKKQQGSSALIAQPFSDKTFKNIETFYSTSFYIALFLKAFPPSSFLN